MFIDESRAKGITNRFFREYEEALSDFGKSLAKEMGKVHSKKPGQNSLLTPSLESGTLVLIITKEDQIRIPTFAYPISDMKMLIR